MTLAEMHVNNLSVILADQLGPEIFTMSKIKGQVLHRVFTFEHSLLVVRLKGAPN